MKGTILTLISLTLLPQIALGQGEDELVRNCFNNYRNAILGENGNEAIKYVNKKTIDYYGKELDLAVNGDSSTVSRLEILDKMTVFIARHRIPKQELLRMTGRNFFVYAVDHGMIGRNSVMTLEIGEIDVKESVASAQVISNGKRTPLYFQFSREDNEWKVDLTSIFPPTNMALKRALSDQGFSDIDFIFQTLEALTGRKVTEDIWMPLK